MCDIQINIYTQFTTYNYLTWC